MTAVLALSGVVFHTPTTIAEAAQKRIGGIPGYEDMFALSEEQEKIEAVINAARNDFGNHWKCGVPVYD